MKKTYQKPEITVTSVVPQTLIAVSGDKIQLGGSYSGGKIGAKDRGDYEPEDNTSFGDLW
ncbi:MAG: hypothetical protein IJV06_08675 [Bacteroidaceae bacterium]|nr:hypothetical protein [Bacteroidaceae bacterium]